MQITIAKEAGFCPGVRRAAETVEKLLREASPDRYVYTLGRLIHNDSYCAHLASLGCGTISREDIPEVIRRAEAGEKITVVIRAHGEICSVLEALEECAARCGNLTVVNCTCPYVERVRRIARDNSGGEHLFLLLGAKDHPEVEGIMSCAADPKAVFADAEELNLWILSKRYVQSETKKVSLAAQTTQKLSE